MSLTGALLSANSGLANINAQLALVSQNVANASTTGYAVETAAQTSLTAGGVGYGVQTGPATTEVNAALEASVNEQAATVSSLTTQQSALQQIDAVLGTPGSGDDLSSLVDNLQNAFSTLAGDPSDQTQQQQVVADAQTLAQGINTLSSSYGSARQAAETAIVSDVSQVNTALATIGTLSSQIVALKANGQSTADLENQRDEAVSSLSQVVGVKTTEQANGDMLVFTNSGTQLPTHDGATPLSTSATGVSASAYYPGGGIPAITLNGLDVTQQLTGGSLGGNVTLRDSTLPTSQAELDEFSQNLASSFAASGLTLFSDPSGNVPASGGTPAQANYIGFANAITVNPAVVADPSAVRDGTPSTNTSNLAGYTGTITNVLDTALGTAQTSQTSGLGPSGTLSAPYTSPATLGALATALVSAQSQVSATVTSQTTTEQSLQTSLQSKLASQAGVSIDSEMSNMIQLQNAYGANAKIIAAVQAMWDQLIQTVGT